MPLRQAGTLLACVVSEGNQREKIGMKSHRGVHRLFVSEAIIKTPPFSSSLPSCPPNPPGAPAAPVAAPAPVRRRLADGKSSWLWRMKRCRRAAASPGGSPLSRPVERWEGAGQ